MAAGEDTAGVSVDERYLNWGIAQSERRIAEARYVASKLADFHGEDDRKLPIILGSRSGNFLAGKPTWREACEDTAVAWDSGLGWSGVMLGSQGSGKGWCCWNYMSQKISYDQRFGVAAMPMLMGDAAPEVHRNGFMKPLEDKRMLARLRNYTKHFPFIYPIDLLHKAIFCCPTKYARQLHDQSIYDDIYFTLQAKDFKDLEQEVSKGLIMELLNIAEDDPAERMVRQGVDVIYRMREPHFLDVWARMRYAAEQERKTRRSTSVSRQADIKMAYLLSSAEVEVGSNVPIKEILENRLIAVFHTPIGSLDSKYYQVLLTLQWIRALKYTMAGAPPFSIYLEEAHKILETKGIMSKKFMELWQLWRKCVVGDTYIFMSNGELITAKEMCEGYLNSINPITKQLSIEHSTKITHREAEVIQIQTKHGYTIKTTPDHLLLTIDGWKEAQTLTPNDRIATARKWITEDITPELRYNGKRTTILLDKTFAYFIGTFIGDGNFSGSEKYSNLGVAITTMSKCVKMGAKRIAKRLHKKLCHYKSHKSRATTYRINHRDLHFFARTHIAPKQINKTKAENVSLPKILMQRTDTLRAMLQGLYDTDGWAGNAAIHYISKSKRLTEELQYALLRFGIISTRRPEYKKYNGERREYWCVSITDQDSLLHFKNEISFRVPHRLAKLNQIALSYGKKATRYDKIPITPRQICSFMREQGIPHRPTLYHKWSSAYHHSYSLGGVSRNELIKILEGSKPSPTQEYFVSLLNADILWDSIISITPLGKEIVYDLEVPTTHNFIGNAIVLHNSGRMAIAVIRMPSYSPTLCAESNFIISSRMPFSEAKVIQDFVPDPNFSIDLTELKINPHEASEFIYAERGGEYQRFYSLPPLTQPSKTEIVGFKDKD